MKHTSRILMAIAVVSVAAWSAFVVWTSARTAIPLGIVPTYAQ